MAASPTAITAARSAGPLSHTHRWDEAVVQAVSPPGVLDLGPGYLEPGLLPVDLLGDAYALALAEFGSAALGYGANPGARPLRECLAARAAAASGHPCDADHVLVTAGTSHAMHLIATTMAAPGQVVLVDSLSYDFGRRILADQGLLLREVPGDGDGMDPQALHEALVAERAAGRAPAFVLLNPTFHNPTGLVVGTARRRELLAVAARHEVLVVEDDAYAELALDDGERPAPLAALAGYRGVVRLGTFAKTLAPGLRLGWLLAEPPVVAALAERGLLVSGGCLNHLTSLAVAVLLRDGGYDRHLDWLRGELRARRDALVGSLREHAGESVGFTRPAGGFFLWLRFPGGRTEPELVAAAARGGVAVAAGSRFGTAPGPHLRLAYSFNPPDRLTAAASLLARAWKRTPP